MGSGETSAVAELMMESAKLFHNSQKRKPVQTESSNDETQIFKPDQNKPDQNVELNDAGLYMARARKTQLHW